MVIQCLDLLLGCLAYVVLHELILICVVLALFILTAIRSFSLFSLIKLILGPINFLTIQKPELVNMAGVSDALKPKRFIGGDHFKK
jgi:hypothetical protein